MKKHEHVIIIAIVVFFVLLSAGVSHFAFGSVNTSRAVVPESYAGYLQHDLSVANFPSPILPTEAEIVYIPEPEPVPIQMPAHRYVVTSQNGFIVVLYAVPEGETEQIMTITNTSVNSLAIEEQERLAQGINIYTEDALFRILEDYGS